MKGFLDLAHLGHDGVVDLLGLASRLADRPEPAALAGRTLGLVFFNPSLRTLASMQVAMAQLGGTSFVITPGSGSWDLETRIGAVMNGKAAEHIREAIPVLASYCDVLGVRAFAEGRDLATDLTEPAFGQIAALCDKPLINLESAANHPCQALADWKTLDDLAVPRRAKFVLSWANHPRALPIAVPAAAAHMAALRGMEVVVLRPEGFRAARTGDAEGARGGSRHRRQRHGDDRPQGGARRRARRLCQGVGLDRALRRRGRGRVRARGAWRLDARRVLVCGRGTRVAA